MHVRQCLAILLMAATLSAAVGARAEGLRGIGRERRAVRAPAMAPLSAPPALDCVNPLSLSIGDVVSGSTIGMASQADAYGCSAVPETGGEVVYLLEIASPIRFELRLESEADLDLIVLGGCDPMADCLALGDVGVRALDPSSGSFYVVVDGYAGAAGGYTLTASELIEPELPAVACASAVPIPPGGDPSGVHGFIGTTCGGIGYLESMLCSYSEPLGKEVWYQIAVSGGGSVDASVINESEDLALWLLRGCESNSECLAYADQEFDGGTEDLHWTNPLPGTQIVYLVVDTYGDVDACADYFLSIEADIVVASTPASWTAVKARFRSTRPQEVQR